MGEIAEAFLDGTFCQSCGELLIGEGEEPMGFPGYCAGCAPSESPAYQMFPRSMARIDRALGKGKKKRKLTRGE